MKRKFAQIETNQVREINIMNIPEAVELVSLTISSVGSPRYPILSSGAFLHQLYDLIGNATQVDQELHELRKQNLVKVISCKRIHTDISYIMLTTAYCAGLSSHNELATNIFLALLSIPKFAGCSSFIVSELLDYADEKVPDKLSRRHIDRLIDLGYLVMDSSNLDAIWLSYPTILLITRQLVDGNQEIIRSITRKKYHEVYERELIKNVKLRCSQLPILYHLHDLVGKAMIVRIQRAGENAVNNLYRLA
jgi:hypothetical protein